jgi:hypothetical protein
MQLHRKLSRFPEKSLYELLYDVTGASMDTVFELLKADAPKFESVC